MQNVGSWGKGKIVRNLEIYFKHLTEKSFTSRLSVWNFMNNQHVAWCQHDLSC